MWETHFTQFNNYNNTGIYYNKKHLCWSYIQYIFFIHSQNNHPPWDRPVLHICLIWWALLHISGSNTTMISWIISNGSYGQQTLDGTIMLLGEVSVYKIEIFSDTNIMPTSDKALVNESVTPAKIFFKFHSWKALKPS